MAIEDAGGAAQLVLARQASFCDRWSGSDSAEARAVREYPWPSVRVIPVVFVLEALNRHADGVHQLDPLALVGQAAGVLACDGQGGAVLGLEGGEVLDHEAVAAGGKLSAREGEVDSVGESDQVEIDWLGPDVGQLDVLGVGVVGIARLGRVVHDLADPETLRHGTTAKTARAARSRCRRRCGL